MPPHRQQRRPYPSPPPSIHPSHETVIPLQHPIRSFFPEQPRVQGPSVQEMMNTGLLPGSPRLTLAMARRTGPGTRVGIVRRSDMVFENLMSDTPRDGGFDFGVGPEMVRQRKKLQKTLPLQKKGFDGLRDVEPPGKTIISLQTAEKNRYETDSLDVTAVAGDELGTICPEPPAGHDSFRTDDSFNSLDSVVIHDGDREWDFRDEDPILNPAAGKLRFRNRESFTVFAKSVGLLHIEEDEEENRQLTLAGVEDFRAPDLPRSKFPMASARCRIRSPSPPRLPTDQTTPIARRKPIRVPSPKISGKLRKRLVRTDWSPKPANNHKRSRSSTPPKPSMGSRFAQHLIARAGGNEIVNQAVVNHDDECIVDCNLSDTYHPCREKAQDKGTAKPAPKRVKVEGHTKIHGLQGAYGTLPRAYPFGAPLQGSRFVMAGEATSLEEAFQQSRDAEARRGDPAGLLLNSRPETPSRNSPPLATRGSETSTSRLPRTQSGYSFGGTTQAQEMMRADVHIDAQREEHFETNRMQRGHHERRGTPPVTAAESEHHLPQRLGIARVLKHAHVHASTGDRVGNHGVPQHVTFARVRVQKRPRELTVTAHGDVPFAITQPAKDATKDQSPSSGVFGAHNELGRNLQASNVNLNSECANSTDKLSTHKNMENASQGTPPPQSRKMADPHPAKNQRQDPLPPQLQRQHNHAYPFQPHPSTDPSLWPQIANHPPFPRIKPNQEPCSPIKELISGDTTAIDIAEVKSRGPACSNPANACLVHRGMKDTPENPHFQELQEIRGTKRLKTNAGNMEYLEKKIHQGKLQSIDYVPDSEFRTHYHDTQGYWTADRCTGQLTITDGVLNVQSALGASWDCTTENGTKVAGRGYLETNHVADAGQEKHMHDAHQLGFSPRAKRIPPIVVTPTPTTLPTPVLSGLDIAGKLLQPDNVNWSDFLVDEDAAETRADLLIGLGRGYIHGDWQLTGADDGEARTSPSNGVTQVGKQNGINNRGEDDVQMMEVQQNLGCRPITDNMPTRVDVTITTTGGRDTGSDSDLDSVLGELRKEDPQVIQVGDLPVFIAPRTRHCAERGPNDAKNGASGVIRRKENNAHQMSPGVPHLHPTFRGIHNDNTRVVQRENGSHILNAMREVGDVFKDAVTPINNADEPAAPANGVPGSN